VWFLAILLIAAMTRAAVQADICVGAVAATGAWHGVRGVARDHVPDLMFGLGGDVFKYFVFNRPDWDYSTYASAPNR
jgi:hypothetical protein